MTEETRIVEEGTAAVVEAAEAETTTVEVVEASVAELVVETAVEAVAEVSEEAEVVAESVLEAVAETAEAAATEAVADEAAPIAEAVAEVAVGAAQGADAVTESVVESVSDTIADTIADAVAEAVETVTEKVEEIVEAVSEAVTETAEAVTEKVAEVVESVDETVSEKVSEVVAEVTDSDEADGGDAEGGDRRVVRLSVGQEVQGIIKRITDFGAFVDIGAGRDGLIHISELAVGRVNQVADVVQSGQEMTFWIKKLDRARNRISLTLISPETKTIKDINDGDVVPGTVARFVPYGAFIYIGVGTDALLHVREMSNNYVAKPEDVVKLDESLDVRILSVNRRRRRIDVSLKGLRDEPEPEMVEVDAAAAALGAQEGKDIVDSYEDVQVLSPMELAFKRAMEVEGVEVNTAAAGKRRGGRSKKARSMQDEIIRRTLETMRE